MEICCESHYRAHPSIHQLPRLLRGRFIDPANCIVANRTPAAITRAPSLLLLLIIHPLARTLALDPAQRNAAGKIIADRLPDVKSRARRGEPFPVGRVRELADAK